MRFRRQCEGYDAYPVFINRGQDGFLKRSHLDETKSLVGLPPRGSTAPLISAEWIQGAIQDNQFIAAFWEKYASTNGSLRPEEPAWLFNIISMPETTALLRQALLAIAYTRAGRSQNNLSLISQGQMYYGLTLQMMQQALYKPELAASYDTLAAARCMCLYEAFELTTNSMTSWIHQTQGMARILEFRGPSSFQSPVCRAILESMRLNLMIHSIIMQTPSFLALEPWREQPWLGTVKPLEQQVYDHGFTLTSLIHRVDRAGEAEEGLGQVLVDTIIQILESYHSLTVLNEELIRMYRVGFNSTRTASLSVASASLLGIDLSFSFFACGLLRQCGQELLDENRSVIERVTGYIDKKRRRQLAHQIVLHVEMSLVTEAFAVVSSLVFALNCARFELRDSTEHKTRIKMIMKTLETRGSHRIITGIRTAGQSMVPPIARKKATIEEGSLS